MVEFINGFGGLGSWATVLVGLYLSWKFIFSSIFDSWLNHRLDVKKRELSIALAIEKDFTVKRIEFEYVKLKRVLPLLEEVNSAIHDHRMMLESYINAIRNKGGIGERMEEERLAADKKMIEKLSQLGIYLPEEFRKLLNEIRCVMSCSWQDPLVMSRVLSHTGGKFDVLSAALRLHEDLMGCFYDMCNGYINSSGGEVGYAEIMRAHQLDSRSKTIHQDAVSQLAWMFILLPEYYGSDDIILAQQRVEEKCKRTVGESA